MKESNTKELLNYSFVQKTNPQNSMLEGHEGKLKGRGEGKGGERKRGEDRRDENGAEERVKERRKGKRREGEGRRGCRGRYTRRN